MKRENSQTWMPQNIDKQIVDEAFYFALCGGNKKAQPSASLASVDDRNKFLESVA